MECAEETLAGSGGNMVWRSPGRQTWTADDVAQLRKLAAEKLPTRLIARRLGRSIRAVQTRAREEGILLPGIRVDGTRAGRVRTTEHSAPQVGTATSQTYEAPPSGESGADQVT